MEPHVLFPVFGLLLLGVIWGATYHLIALERTSAERSAVQSSRELIDTYEAQMARNLGAIDQTLRTVKYAAELRGKQAILPDLLEKRLLPSALVFGVSIADRHGTVVANDRSGELTRVVGKNYFRSHRGYDDDSAFVDLANRNWNTGEAELQFSRRLNAVDGSFDGVVILTVDPAYFTSGYEHSRMGERGLLGLLGSDGVFRAQRSGDQVFWGQAIDYAAVMQVMNGQDVADGDEGILTGLWDGTLRYSHARPLHGFPLTAVVGLSRDEQLAPFHERRNAYLWQAAAFSALLLVIGTALSRLSLQLVRTRKHARKIEETYHAASEASLDAYFDLQGIRDANGHITDFVLKETNSQGENLTGISRQALIGKSMCKALPQCLSNGIFEKLVAVSHTGVLHEEEWQNQMPELRADWLHCQIVRVADGVVVIARDISERKQLEMRVQYQATHDALTGLANRNLLNDRLHQTICYASRYAHQVWVVFVDLDRFKSINDSLGHKAGDLFLVTIAERLRVAIRDTDTVARIGGDEFVLILPGTADGYQSTSTLRRIMEAVAQPLMIEGRQCSLSCSIGVTVYPDDGLEPESLIERADIAMYRAKESGRNNFQFYTVAMNESLLDRLRIEHDLRNAIERQEFVLHYQPQVDLHSGQMTGMEALIRWRHPELGMLPPDRFIGVAEETGLIVPIGAWVLRTACTQNMAWQRAGLRPIRIAINLSVLQFAHADLVQSITEVLEETGLDARYVDIELTESLVMKDVEHAIGVLRRLKALGVLLSIDDFGTGYSSLSYLKRFPIDVLKIDQSFVQDIAVGSDDAAIVVSIISLAHSLRLQVIAEGVETEAQMVFLQRQGCDAMQGYYFSQPLPALEAELLMREEPSLSARAQQLIA